MKTKRFAALAIAVSLVLTLVQGFSFTAGATSTTSVIDLLGGEVLWGCPDGSFNDTAVGDAFSGWSSAITNGYVNVRTYSVGNTLQYYVNGTNNETVVTSPGYGGNGEEKIIIEWIMKRQAPSDLYFDFSFKDINGTEIAFLKFDKNYTSVTADYDMGYPAEGTDCAIVAYNNTDGSTHTVDYYVGGQIVMTESDLAGQISGFKSIVSSSGYWSTAWNHIGFANLTVGGVYASDTRNEVTVTYTVNGTAVGTESGIYDSAEGESGYTFEEKYIYTNGEVYYAPQTTLSESGAVEMTITEHYTTKAEGTVFMVGESAYRATGDSVIVNGNFITGDTGAWTNRAGGDITGATVAYDSTIDGNAMTISTAGASATNSIGTAWSVEAGETYYLSFYVGGTKPSSGNYQYNRVFQADKSTEILAYGENMTDGAWKRFEAIVTPTGNSIYFQGSWASEIKYASFELVPVEEANDQIAVTTIKFIDSNSYEEIQSAVTLNGLVGDAIDIDSIAPQTITSDGVIYSRDSSNQPSHIVETTADVVEVTYTVDAVALVDSTTNVTIIEGSQPVLPTTLNATTASGAQATVTVTGWDTSNLTEGENMVYGTIYGTTVQATATVNVLGETFSLEDKSSVNGQSEADINLTIFPTTISDEFVMQMDVEMESFGDLWITLKNSEVANYFGPEQVPVGFNAEGGFRPVNGNGTGGRVEADSTLAVLDSSVTYRLMITADASLDTYTAAITSPDGTVTVAEDFGFRTDADFIDALAIFTNNGAGKITASNIKVHAPSVAEQFVDYTVTIIGAGDYNATYAEKAVDAKDIEIPYNPGYVFKKRDIDGTSVTFTYAESMSTLGTWATRNNVSDATAFNQMKFLGSHNSFTDKMEASRAYADEAGILYGDDGAEAAESGSSTAFKASKAQSADALEQLNAGVRFFDVRLSRFSDGTFYTRHGLISEDFKTVATTIAQFAEENPGEVIVLDFQSLYDAKYTTPISGDSTYNGEAAGDDNKAAYNALYRILCETALADYIPEDKSLTQSYGALTEDGNKAAVICFAKSRGANCISQFVSRDNITAVYTSNSSYSSIVNYINSNYTTSATFKTIHAYTTNSVASILFGGNSLLEDAAENNPDFINEENFEAWMQNANVIVLDDVITNAADYLEKIQEYNRDGFDGIYSNTLEGVTVTGETSSVPFSTELVVTVTDVSGEENITVGDSEITTLSEYTVDLIQYDVNAVSPAGEVSITFPMVSTDNTTVDVLIDKSDMTVVAEAEVGGRVTIEATVLGEYILGTKESGSED